MIAKTIKIDANVLRQRSMFVATPMYGGACAGPFTQSLLGLQEKCLRVGVKMETKFVFNESLITRARNYLVDMFLQSKCTHLMFIDGDICFNPDNVLQLLALDKPIIGGPYTKKTIAYENVVDAVKLGMAEKNPLHLDQYSGDFVFNPVPGTTEFRLDEPVEVMEIGTGFMMIKREVFEQFKNAYPELAYKPDHNRTKDFDGSRKIHAYFDALIEPTSERYLSEDYMFCQWSRKIGISVYLCPWMNMQHLGTHVYSGTMAGQAALSNARKAAGWFTPPPRDYNEEVKPIHINTASPQDGTGQPVAPSEVVTPPDPSASAETSPAVTEEVS